MTAQRGFTLVSAIFLMVVLVVLGASLVTLSSVQHTTAAQQLQAVRATYAIRAGIEWAMGQTAVGACPAGPTTLNAPGPGGTLAGFTITVSCTPTSHVLDGAPLQYYVVDVTASSGAYGGVDYVLRRAQTKVRG